MAIIPDGILVGRQQRTALIDSKKIKGPVCTARST